MEDRGAPYVCCKSRDTHAILVGVCPSVQEQFIAWDTREISFWVNQDLEILEGGDAVVLLGFGGFVCLFLVFLVFFAFCLVLFFLRLVS